MGKRAVILSALLALLASLLLSGGAEVVLVTGDRSDEVASRVAEAFHSTTDSTRPPPVCVPAACTPTSPGRPAAPATSSVRCMALTVWACAWSCSCCRPAARPQAPSPRCWAVMPARSAAGSTATTSTASPDCVTSLGLAVHAWAAHGAPSASCGWWPSPRSGRSLGSTQRLGRPAMSLATFRRRVREVAGWRLPRLVAKGDPDREAVLASLHQRLTELPEDAVVLAEDETPCTCCPGCAPPGSPTVRANR